MRSQITDLAGLAAAGLDGGQVAVRATEAYLLQILRHGFLHAGIPPLLPLPSPTHTPFHPTILPAHVSTLFLHPSPSRLDPVIRIATAQMGFVRYRSWASATIAVTVWKCGCADPHPGNIAVGDSGQLIFYDFGECTLRSGLHWSCI